MLQSDLIGALPQIPAASPQFLIIGAAVVLLARFGKGRILPLGLAAFGMLIAVSWATQIQFLLLAASLIGNYALLAATWGKSTSLSKALVNIGVAYHVILLVLTKIEVLAGSLGIAGTIGISYLTFRQIQLLLTADRAKAPLDFALWLSFLINPLTLIAGPIQRWESHLQDFQARLAPDWKDRLEGLQRITKGGLKILVLAPVFAGHSDFAALASGTPANIDLIIAFYSYYIFLFLDFSGYIDIVVGISRMAGFKHFPENFNRPYMAADFQDFWNRWNMTLGNWFKTFLFMPLHVQLSRTLGPKRQNLAIASSLFLTFFLVGLWHGVAWNFVVFGAIQATGVSLTYWARTALVKHYGRKRFAELDSHRIGRAVRIFVFQHIVAFSFLFLDNDVGDVLAVLW